MMVSSWKHGAEEPPPEGAEVGAAVVTPEGGAVGALVGAAVGDAGQRALQEAVVVGQL